jgi:hypothetical protein
MRRFITRWRAKVGCANRIDKNKQHMGTENAGRYFSLNCIGNQARCASGLVIAGLLLAGITSGSSAQTLEKDGLAGIKLGDKLSVSNRDSLNRL